MDASKQIVRRAVLLSVSARHAMPLLAALAISYAADDQDGNHVRFAGPDSQSV